MRAFINLMLLAVMTRQQGLGKLIKNLTHKKQ